MTETNSETVINQDNASLAIHSRKSELSNLSEVETRVQQHIQKEQ